jgi:hypothetical protein
MFTSLGLQMAFFPFEQIETISPRPILMLAGSEADTLYFSKDVYERAKELKDLFIIPGASHIDLYDKPQFATPGVAKLKEFFGTALKQGSHMMSTEHLKLLIALTLVLVSLFPTSGAMADGNGKLAPLIIQEQGSFAVGGTVITTPGSFDPVKMAPEGQTFHGDHAYVFCQVVRRSAMTEVQPTIPKSCSYSLSSGLIHLYSITDVSPC